MDDKHQEEAVEEAVSCLEDKVEKFEKLKELMNEAGEKTNIDVTFPCDSNRLYVNVYADEETDVFKKVHDLSGGYKRVKYDLTDGTLNFTFEIDIGQQL